MKISVAILSLFLVSAASSAQTSITDFIKLSDYMNARGLAADIKGELAVTLNAHTTEVSVGFKEYNGNLVCTEYGPEEIPRHNETAPCLKSEMRWTPRVVLTSVNPSFVADIGGKKVNLSVPTESQVQDACIANLDELIQVRDDMPTNAPAKIVLKAECAAISYSDNRGLIVKPKVMNGEKVEAVIAAVLKTEWKLAADLVLTRENSELLPDSAVSLSIVPAQVDIFGPAFQYDARLFVK